MSVLKPYARIRSSSLFTCHILDRIALQLRIRVAIMLYVAHLA